MHRSLNEMKNPCTECLVKMICRDICNEKLVYRNFLVNTLCDINRERYNEKGYKILHVSARIEREHKRLVDLCEEDSLECDKIFNRYLESLNLFQI